MQTSLPYKLKLLLCSVYLVFASSAHAIIPDPRLFQQALEVPYAFDAYQRRYKLKFVNRTDRYDVYIVKPGIVGQPLHFLPMEAMRYLWKEQMAYQAGKNPNSCPPFYCVDNLDFATNRVSTYYLLQDVYQFLLKEWEHAGLLIEGYGKGPFVEYQTIRDGKWPVVVLTEEDNPHNILYVLAIALDWGQGLPFEWRAFGRDLKGNLPQKMPDKEVRLEKQHRMFRSLIPDDLNRELLIDNSRYNHLFSLLPGYTGERAELKNYAKKHEFPENLSHVLHSLALRHELHRWSATKLTRIQRKRLRRLFRRLRRNKSLVAEIRRVFPEYDNSINTPIEKALLNMFIQPTVEVSHIYAEVNGAVRDFHQFPTLSKLYMKRYGMGAPKWWYIDPDIKSKREDGERKHRTDLFESERYSFEDRMGLELGITTGWQAWGAELENAPIPRAEFASYPCVLLLTPIERALYYNWFQQAW